MDSRERTLVPIKNALDYCSTYFGKNAEVAKAIDINGILSEIANEKVAHQTLKGRYVIDFDLFVERMLLAKFKYFRKRYGVLFDAIDVEKQECIGIDQFMMLMRLFERKKVSFRKSLRIFSKYVDFVDEDALKNYLSFKEFALCLERESLLSKEVMDEFMKSSSDQINSLRSLEVDWPLKKNLIRLKFIKARSYNLFYQKLLTSFDYFFPLQAQDADCEMMWMRYKILEKISNEILVDSLTEGLLVEELSDICKLTKNLTE
jgi:hypothetical protein